MSMTLCYYDFVDIYYECLHFPTTYSFSIGFVPAFALLFQSQASTLFDQ